MGRGPDGEVTKDWLYVLTAVGLFEHRWKDFYRSIVRRKRELPARIRAVHGIELDLDSGRAGEQERATTGLRWPISGGGITRPAAALH